MMALFPALMADAEFEEKFTEYYDEFISGFPDFNHTKECMAYLCDNAYRRIKDPGCTAHLEVNVDKSGNLMRVSQAHLDSGTFTPTSVVAGDSRFSLKPAQSPSGEPAPLSNTVISWASTSLTSAH